MSLYLKYRPKTFEDVVEQSHIKDVLKAQLISSQASNNYLFFWPRGTWKTTIARILAKAVNCTNLKDWNPCNECANCISVWKNQSLDFVEIDAASHTQVDNIREEIIEKAPYPPATLKKKVYIIDEVHMLSKWAFNALLKIMEEPPAYLTFILATTEINKVPDTIASRCQVFNFKKLNEDFIVKRLKYICEQENFNYEEDALKLIAKVSDWALRDAIKYLDQVSILGVINTENVSRFLWVAPDFLIKQFIDAIRVGEIKEIFAQVDNLQNSWIDLVIFAKEMLMYIDAHLMDDLDFFVRLGEFFREIVISVRNYPYPAMIYKVNFYKYFWNSSSDSQTIQKPISPKPTPTVPKSTTPTTKTEEFKTSDSVESPNDIVNSNDTKSNINSQSNMSDTNSSETSIITTDLTFDNILHQAADISDKIPVKSALKRYVNVESIDGWLVNLIVINQLQYSILTKEWNIQHLNSIFSKVLWLDARVALKFISKEDFLKQQLLF